MPKKLLNESWECYKEWIMAWQIERGYLKFGRNYHIKADISKGKWQKEIKANE
jgi:hypothetical protein